MVLLAEALLPRVEGPVSCWTLRERTTPRRFRLPPAVEWVPLGGRRTLDALPRLVGRLREERPRWILAATLEAGAAVLLARRLAGSDVRVVVRVQIDLRAPGEHLPSGWRFRGIRHLVRALLRPDDRVVAVTGTIAEEAERLLGRAPGSSVVLPGPILGAHEPREEVPERRTHPWLSDGGDPVVLSVGRLHAQKAPDVLLRALGESLSGTPFRVLYLGEGPMRPELEREVDARGLRERVRFAGWVDRPIEWMRHADAVVSTSRWEGLPAVLIEALSVGCPIVACDAAGGGPREILASGARGVLVPVGDASALARGIRDALSLPALPFDDGPYRATTVADRLLSLLETPDGRDPSRRPGVDDAPRERESGGRARATAFATLCALVLAILWLRPGRTDVLPAERLPLAGPLEHVEGFHYRAEVPSDWPWDRPGRRPDSRLELWEDGRPSGPGARPLAEIAKDGAGRYAHHRGVLHLSTRTGAPPETVRLEARRPRPVPWSVFASMMTASFVLGAFLLSSGAELARRRGSSERRWVFGLVVWAVFVVQGLAWAWDETELALRGRTEEGVYRRVLGRGGGVPVPLLRFEPHHFLTYALSGEVQDDGHPMHEPTHRIRRSEPLRPGSEVDWRILVLGGSTTYDNTIDREEETWVHRVESDLRDRYGPRIDVVNGGVGGYTVVENLLHYATHLTHLDPDVVLLFVGINDVHPRLYGDLAIDYSNYRKRWSGAEALERPPAFLRIWPLYRWLHARTVLFDAGRRTIGFETRGALPPLETWSDALDRNGPDVFREALANLAGMVRSRGRQVAFLPQHYDPRSARDRLLARGVAQHNRVLADVADRMGAPLFDALLAEDAFERFHTVDSCHFGPDGARRMASLVLGELERHGLLAERRELRSSSTQPRNRPAPRSTIGS